MRLRNGEHGYGLVTKLLHWLTVAALVAQFAVGWTMDGDDAAVDRQEDRLEQREERLEEQAEAEGEAAEERLDEEQDRIDDRLDAEGDRLEDEYVDTAFEDVVTLRFLDGGVAAPEWHVLLGWSIILLALLRLLWRSSTPLPPWAEHLGPRERTLESWLEKAMLSMLIVTPATGLLLVAGRHDWLPVHVVAQVVLLAVIACHVGLVLSHTVVRRTRHLSRLL